MGAEGEEVKAKRLGRLRSGAARRGAAPPPPCCLHERPRPPAPADRDVVRDGSRLRLGEECVQVHLWRQRVLGVARNLTDRSLSANIPRFNHACTLDYGFTMGASNTRTHDVALAPPSPDAWRLPGSLRRWSLVECTTRAECGSGRRARQRRGVVGSRLNMSSRSPVEERHDRACAHVGGRP